MKFNKLSHEEKIEIQKNVNECMDAVGGRNYFFTMIENIKESKQHPLLNKTGKYHFENGTITWGKEIYKDKIDALKSRLIASEDDNILNTDNLKLKKAIVNTVKTLGKLEFIVHVKGEEVFKFKPFITVSDTNVELNHFFQIIFFDSLNNTKRILDYK